VRPRIPTFLQCRVVQLAVGFHTRRQRHMLAGRGQQPEHIRASHEAITASHWCSMSRRTVDSET
jgi:hypothetical protein